MKIIQRVERIGARKLRNLRKIHSQKIHIILNSRCAGLVYDHLAGRRIKSNCAGLKQELRAKIVQRRSGDPHRESDDVFVSHQLLLRLEGLDKFGQRIVFGKISEDAFFIMFSGGDAEIGFDRKRKIEYTAVHLAGVEGSGKIVLVCQRAGLTFSLDERSKVGNAVVCSQLAQMNAAGGIGFIKKQQVRKAVRGDSSFHLIIAGKLRDRKCHLLG